MGRLMRKGTSFGQDVFLNEDGTALRGHNANALTHAMILMIPGVDCAGSARSSA